MAKARLVSCLIGDENRNFGGVNKIGLQKCSEYVHREYDPWINSSTRGTP